MNLPVSVGIRYARSRRGGRFLSFVSLVSFLGLFLGVVALVVVVSVMNGFDRELKQRILGVVPHVVVTSEDLETVSRLAAEQPGGSSAEASLFISARGLIMGDRGSHLLELHGLDIERTGADSLISRSVVSGELTDLIAPGTIMLGEPVARRFGLVIGDELSLVMPKVTSGGNGVRPQIYTVVFAGAFRLGSELDYGLAVMSWQELQGLTGELPGVRLHLDDIFAAPGVSAGLRQQGYEVRDWTLEHGDFFETVRMEKIMMFILLSFVVAVAAFSIVSGLSMMVDSKRTDIAVLRTMGLSVQGVLLIFVTQGMLVAAIAISAGLLVGIPLAFEAPAVMAFIEELTGASIIRGTYFDRIPVDVRTGDLVAIVLTTLSISLAASIYPSWHAARLDPSVILRYE